MQGIIKKYMGGHHAKHDPQLHNRWRLASSANDNCASAFLCKDEACIANTLEIFVHCEHNKYSDTLPTKHCGSS